MPCRPAGGLVGLVVELAAVLEHRHHAFQGRFADVRVDVDGDAAAVVGDGDRAVGVDGHLDDVGVAGHDLVDRVVDDFAHQVVQAAEVAVADVHAGALADVLQIAHVAHLFGAVLGRSRLSALGIERWDRWTCYSVILAIAVRSTSGVSSLAGRRAAVERCDKACKAAPNRGRSIAALHE